MIIFTWTCSYIRIQGGFLDFYDKGGFGYSKLVVKSPEMVSLKYLGVIIFTIGFLGLLRYLPQNEIYYEMKPKSLDPEYSVKEVES